MNGCGDGPMRFLLMRWSLLLLTLGHQWTVQSQSLLLDYKPPNEVISAELVCTDRDMQLHVLLREPLAHAARVFVKEQSADPHCVHHYASNSSHNALMFRVPLSTCGMQRVQQQTSRFSFTTSVVVSFHRFFVSSHDRAFRITCDYAQTSRPPLQEVTVGVGVNEVDENEVADVFPEMAADCSYELFVRRNSTSAGMETARTVRVGDELEHRWRCRGLRARQFLFVHDCFVNPEFSLGEDPLLVDADGCVADANGIGQIQYEADGSSAWSRHLAYKFADYPNLLFKCAISVCGPQRCRLSDGTPVTLPLNCGAKRRGTRSSTAHRPQALELSGIVRVEERLSEEDLGTTAGGFSVHGCPGSWHLLTAAGSLALFAAALLLVFCCRDRPSACHCERRVY